MNTKKTLAFTSSLVLCAILAVLQSCSTAPKKQMEVNTIKNSAAAQLEQGNKKLLFGYFEQAEEHFNKAYNSAMSVDAPQLLTYISLGRVSLSLSKKTPSSLTQAEAYLNQAFRFADCEASDFLKAVCMVYKAKILVESNDPANIQQAIQLVQQNQKTFAKDDYYTAYSYRVLGDAQKQLKNYSAAETQYLQAEKIHTEKKFLAEIGLDWYSIAQVRSLANNKKGALEALNKAIFYDRSAENPQALGMDYYALGLILTKNDQASPQEKSLAIQYFNHSAEIFTASGFTDLAKISASKAAEVINSN